MTKFDQYTDSILSALQFNPHSKDVIEKKYEIISGVYHFYNLEPSSVLFIGFNPAILASKSANIAVTEVSDAARQYLTDNGVNYTYIDPANLPAYHKKFEAVIALDEYLTFASSDQQQQDQIKLICSLATDFVISTVRDYKNQDYKDREYSQPVLTRNGTEKRSYIESHDWDLRDRSSWKTTVFEINHADDNLTSYGPYDRKTMYFKQLAKFSLDSGANNFLVHKNLMYKSLIKKNYEHVISITFDGYQ